MDIIFIIKIKKLFYKLEQIKTLNYINRKLLNVQRKMNIV